MQIAKLGPVACLVISGPVGQRCNQGQLSRLYRFERQRHYEALIKQLRQQDHPHQPLVPTAAACWSHDPGPTEQAALLGAGSGSLALVAGVALDWAPYFLWRLGTDGSR